MCGIVSIISKRLAGFWPIDLEMFEGLLILDTLRGLDSTGVFCVDSSRQLGYMKIASHPYHLFAMQEYPKWRQRAVNNGRILVGHNRKATQGAISSKNAHPFHAGNIVMVHNGTLRGDHRKDHADVDVDSHALTLAFDEKGAENVLPTINGAFALVWWDASKNSLFVVRNDERPLQVVETEDSYFILSEAWMALQLLARERKKVIRSFDIPAGVLYEFKLGGQYTTTQMELKKYQTVHYHTGRNYGQHESGGSSSVSGGKSQTGSGASNSGTASSPNSQSDQAALLKKTTSPSGTALTLVKNQPSGEAPADQQTEVKMPVDMANHVPCDEYLKHQTILIKLYEMKLTENNQLYLCRGKSMEPNAPEIDVVAYIKVKDIPEGDQLKYLNHPLEAVIVKHTTSTCGRSLYVNKVVLTRPVEVHNGRIAEAEWDYVNVYVKCGQCSSAVFTTDRAYTSVTRRPNNQYSVTCAECVEANLKGAVKHEFHQNRLAAIQAHIQLGEELADRAGSSLEAPGPSTLQ